VSDAVTLRVRGRLDRPVEVDGLTADRLATQSEAELARLPAWQGSREATLGDFFEIRGGRSARVHVEGDVSAVTGLAAGMTAGELVIDGHAGPRVAAGMSGGLVDVRGNVGDDAGLAMGGGVLRVSGHAGARLGGGYPGASKGMTGGEIVVLGSAGEDAAARLRRGLIAIGGDVGANAGRAMIAGSVIVLGGVGPNAGRGNKRGSIVALGEIVIVPTYRYACTFQPPHVRLTLVYLQRRYGLDVPQHALDGFYRRYCGDVGEPGKGEILELTAGPGGG
jgi:formylmethanofuran dehydrogenase subunit C